MTGCTHSLVVSFVCLLGVNFVFGSHWRFGQISWKVTTSTTVEFTAQIGWRSSYIGSNSFAFGDGTSISLSATECPTSVTPCSSDSSSTLYYELLSVTTDLAGSESALIEYIFYHTYSSYSSYTYGLSSCCRIGDLVVGSGDSFAYYGTVALANGNSGSPVSSLAPVVQFSNGVATTIALLPVDNDGDAVTCRAATSSESAIDDNSFYTVSTSACTITMGESGSIGDKWAIQVVMETSAGDKVPMDFILEATDATLEAPKCNLTSPASSDGIYSVNVGSTLSVEMLGTDGDSSSINIQSVSLPSGASISPTGSQSVPVSFWFTWSPADGQQGSFSASVQVSDAYFQSDICTIPILVTNQPTLDPTSNPTSIPTAIPSTIPSKEPTENPSKYPTQEPSVQPTNNPSLFPTMSPSAPKTTQGKLYYLSLRVVSL